MIKLNGESVLEHEIAAVNDSMSHRGPDGYGTWCDRNVAIGHRRLAIIDLNTGAQPMFNIDKTLAITFNGEIYNYQELRAELEKRGYKFATTSDTEVIIQAYAHWGDDCVKRFRGMFAFAIVDSKRRRVFMARDQLGIKPLVYYCDDQVFAFASEIQALRSVPGAKFDINLRSIDEYLWLQYIPAPYSIYNQVHKLPPAHRMSVTFDGKVSQPEAYWRLEFKPNNRKTEDQWLEELENVLRDSVRAHLIADVPVGAFLSGGIDSSLIVAFAAQHLDKPLKTFSIGFKEAEYDESKYAQIAADLWHTDHHTQIVEPDSLGILPEIVQHYGEPFGDSSAIPTYYVSKLAREHVTVSLSGDGGDELFAGYLSYQTWIHYLESAAPKHRLNTLLRRYLPVSNPAADLHTWLNVINYIPANERHTLWRPDYHDEVERPLNVFTDVFDGAPRYDDLSKVQYMDINTYLPFDILTKVDIASMCHSLESRTPLVDVKVAEFVAQIPSAMNFRKTRDGKMEGKVLLKKLTEKYYPHDYVYRPKKGFAVPISKWFANGEDLHSQIQQRLLSSESTLHEYFEPEQIKRFIDNRSQSWIWLLLFLEEWLRQNKT